MKEKDRIKRICDVAAYFIQNASEYGLRVDKGGWALSSELRKIMAENGFELDVEDLRTYDMRKYKNKSIKIISNYHFVKNIKKIKNIDDYKDLKKE